MIRDTLKLAFQNLSNRKLRSWLTMIGIFIGIAAVVALIGLGEGLRTTVISQFGFLGNDILTVQAAGIDYAGPPGTGAINPLSDELAAKIARLSGVSVAFNRHIEGGRVEFNRQQRISIVGSMPVGENRRIFERMSNLKTLQGRLLRDGDDKRVVLGYNFYSRDRFGKPIKAGDRILINGKSFEVAGILERKGSFMFDQIILMNEDAMLDLFENKGTTNIIAVQVRNINEMDKVKEDVERLLRRERNVKLGEEDFSVETPQKILETLESTLFAIQLFVYIIAAISLLVGGIGIMNTMYTAVLERTKEIGIMKAIGAKNSTIFLQFFVESGFLGMVGGIIGVLLGLVLSYGTAYLARLALGSQIIQAHVSPLLIIGALTFSFVLGTLFGVLPALRASKLQPVDALRSK
jgi:putative ABC transport system permease protein